MAGNFAVHTDRFLGLHFSGSGETELLPGESPHMKNFKIIDGYKMLKRDGYRKIASPEGKCRGIWCGALEGEEQLLAVFGTRLYRVGADGSALETGTVGGEGECSFLLFRDRLYLLNGTGIRVYFSGQVRDLTPYRPLVAIATPPGGGGTPFEGVNRLTGQMRQSFTPDGTSYTFRVAVSGLVSIDYVKYNGRTLAASEYSINLGNGSVVLSEAPTVTTPDCLEIGFTKDNPENLDSIHKCRFGISYGGENDTRVFLWGNPDKPDIRYYSDIADGMPCFEYFPENNFSAVGDGERITAIVRQYDRQLIFTKKQAYLSYLEMQTDSMGKHYASFPIRTLSSVRGCVSERFALLADNFPLTVCDDGIFRWTSTNIRDERCAQKISGRIDAALQNRDLSALRAFDYERDSEIWFFSEGEVYLYQYALDVFYCYDNIRALQFACSARGELYFANDDGVFRFEASDRDEGGEIDAQWHSHYGELSGKSEYKDVQSVELILKSEKKSEVSILFAADNVSASSTHFRLKCGYALLDFDGMDFEDFSLDTSYIAKRFKKRLRAKRCRVFKLMLQSTRGRLHILSCAVFGRVSDKKR